MGSMGGMYPGFGSGYMPGQPANPWDPMAGNPSATQALESTTQQTFALLHSIVQTFAGVAQMLESTFVATHSSVFAMAGVVDQFAQLRNALGSVLGLFGLLRWMREMLTGRRGAPGAGVLRGEFRDFVDGRPIQGPAGPPPPRPSRKPLVFFLLAIFGVPWAMHRLVRLLNERQRQLAAAAAAGQPGVPGQPLPPLHPSDLQFARAKFEFRPEAPAELALKENELVAVLGKLDPRTGQEVDPRVPLEGSVEGEWWRGRTRDNREGWFPRKWVEVLPKTEKKEEAKKVE